MKHFLVIPFSVAAAILVGCDSSSTSPDPFSSEPYIKGDLIYERHIDPNGIGSMTCNVYSTGNIVMVEGKVNLLTDNSNMGFQFESNFNKEPAVFRGEYTLDGAFLMQSKQTCDGAKADVENMEDGKTSCSDKKIMFSASVPDVNESNKSKYIASKTTSMKNYCDYIYINTVKQFDEIANSIEPNEITAEKALSCDINVNGNVINSSVVYPNKSSVATATYLGNYKYSIREEYTGIDDATLAKVCEAYKKDEDNSNVVCSGSVFTLESVGPDIDTFVKVLREYQCPAMLNGGMTFEDLWFDED